MSLRSLSVAPEDDRVGDGNAEGGVEEQRGLEGKLGRDAVRPALPPRDDVVEHGEVEEVGVRCHAVVQHDLHPVVVVWCPRGWVECANE